MPRNHLAVLWNCDHETHWSHKPDQKGKTSLRAAATRLEMGGEEFDVDTETLLRVKNTCLPQELGNQIQMESTLRILEYLSSGKPWVWGSTQK